MPEPGSRADDCVPAPHQHVGICQRAGYANGLLDAAELTTPAGTETSIDFGDLLIAVATTLDEIRRCVGCGADSTWAGLYVDDSGLVSVSAWCDATDCEHDRVVTSAAEVLALPINHLPKLRGAR